MSYSDYKLFLQLQENYEFQLDKNGVTFQGVPKSEKSKVANGSWTPPIQRCKQGKFYPLSDSGHNYFSNFSNYESKSKEQKESIELQPRLFSSSQLRIKKIIRDLNKELISYKRIAIEKDYGINLDLESIELEPEPSEEMEIQDLAEEGDDMSESDEMMVMSEAAEEDEDERDLESQIDDEEKFLIEEFLEENGSVQPPDTFTNTSVDVDSMLEKKVDFGNFTMDERLKYYKELLKKEMNIDFVSS